MPQPNYRNGFHSLRIFGMLATSSALTLAAITTAFSGTPSTPPAQVALQNSPKAVLDEAWQIVDRDYVDPQFNRVNWQQVRQSLLSRTYPNNQAAYAALKDALKQLNDPYTRFLNPKEFQALNNEDIDGELIGVGLQLQENPNNQAITVVKAIAQSPAAKAGLKPGDTLLAIDGKRTQGMSIETATRLIRGAANTPVKLLLSRTQKAPYTVTLVRQKIELPVVYSALRQDNNQRIGYIRLAEFSGHAADQMRQAITNLSRQNVDRFVLDLRGNPGGRLDQETAIARMWLNKGAIVRIVDRNGDAEQITANNTALTDRPLAVLVDGGSASASEILTGALKDNHRAIVIGTQTFGKALVQSVNPLSDGSGINVTIAHYFTPNGTDINHRGITPNVVSPLSEAQAKDLSEHPEKLGTAQDPQFRQALSRVEAALTR